MPYASMNDWLDEIENYCLRRERMPEEALPWVEAAWALSAEAERARTSKWQPMHTVPESVKTDDTMILGITGTIGVMPMMWDTDDGWVTWNRMYEGCFKKPFQPWGWMTIGAR